MDSVRDAQRNYKKTKYACYISSMSMAVVSTLSPLLFVTFRELYGVSYTKLGLLVVANFFTQMLVDLAFTFFTKYFNIHKSVRMTPLLTLIGLVIYGALPPLLPQNAFLWIVLGTTLFSVSAGLNEVLLSPVIAAIPSDNPEKEMSVLHSMYAWGVVGVVLISTVALKFLGQERWYFLAFFWALIPLAAFLLFQISPLPRLDMGDAEKKEASKMGKGIILCAICIFFGGATECTMNQWCSDFLESAMEIPKMWGDILGVAVFALLLGLGRSLYAKYGKNILRVMLFGMIGALICYIGAGLSLNPILGLVLCVVTGICVAMLWPGTLICVGENFAGAGVAVYALMAAGGDLGASLGSQMVGILSDSIGATAFASDLAQKLSMTAEQVGMRSAVIIAGIFPLLGLITVLMLMKSLKKKD